MLHRTREGEQIPIEKMADSHLINTIRYLERKAENGFTVRTGGGVDAEDIWYDEYFIQGDEAEAELRLYVYRDEAKKRGIQVCS